MTADDARREEFLPPTELESSVRALGADTVRYCFDYIVLPMRDGVRLRPKLPVNAEGDELARIFRRYSVSVPDFRDPEYATALDKATREAPSGEVLRRMGSPLTGFETFMADGPASPAWRDVDLIDASHTGATPSININGWMDVGAYETVKLFEFQQHHPDQYLIMAPTEHCKMLATSPDARLGQRPMGDTRFPYDEIIISWFDRFLCDDGRPPTTFLPVTGFASRSRARTSR